MPTSAWRRASARRQAIRSSSTTNRWSSGIRSCRAFAASVVIPALNEAANLPHVLARCPRRRRGHPRRRPLDRRHDRRRPRSAPDVRIVLQDGSGKGNALACGFAAATGDIIVMLDADGSTDPAEIPRFVAALLAGRDFAKGSRFVAGRRAAPTSRACAASATGCSARVVNVLFGTRYTDLCYGYNAFWRHCLPHIDVDLRRLRGRDADQHPHRQGRPEGRRGARASRRAGGTGEQPQRPPRRMRVLRTIISEGIRPA